MTVEALLSIIERDTVFYDQSGGGVTFSGGEPLSQPGFLIAMLRRCGEHELHRAVDTSGYASADVLGAVAEHTDLFLYDLKLMDPDAHRTYTGGPNAAVFDNLFRICEAGIPVEVRVPIIPGITDSEKNLEAVGAYLASLPSPPPVALLPHHPVAMDKYARFDVPLRLPETEAPTSEAMAGHAARLRGLGLTVVNVKQSSDGFLE